MRGVREESKKVQVANVPTKRKVESVCFVWNEWNNELQSGMNRAGRVK